jgi:rod shape determining protein RodA
MQNETGSALVYLSFFLMMYREGMTGVVLFAGICAVLYFVVGIKYSVVMWAGTPLGEVIVLTLVCLVLVGMLWFYVNHKVLARNLAIFYVVTAIVVAILFVCKVNVPMLYVLLGVVGVSLLYLLAVYFSNFSYKILVTIVFAIVSVAFLFSCNMVFNKLKSHQRSRIEVLLGMTEDLQKAGYNVNQSKIAIGSGGMWGKGFLNGTQTKLKYVPEQDTDFIFCTIGEEEGFVGSVLVLLLYTALYSLKILNEASKALRVISIARFMTLKCRTNGDCGHVERTSTCLRHACVHELDISSIALYP